MRLKLFKLLSLGLCFSMIAPTLVYGTPVQKQLATEDTDGYDYDIKIPEEMAFPEYVVNEDTYEITDITVEDSEDTEQRTFMDYFPDPIFAQEVAKNLGKNKENLVTISELSIIAQYINLQGKGISSIEGVQYLTNLKYLYLSFNKIIEIPETISQLTNLQILDLSCNQIIEIPESIGHLTNLQNLDLTYNNIVEIPKSIEQLSELQILQLRGNQIIEIPENIGQLTNLQILSLPMNQITEIPESIFQLTNLTGLSLARNQIVEIPDNIRQLENLSVLDLSENFLTEIPESIFQLTNLRYLNLAVNQITEIPNDIGQLTALKSLSLHMNQIAEIPNSFEQLINLESVNISENQITSKLPSIFFTHRFFGLRFLNQNGYLSDLHFTNSTDITYENLLSPFIQQAKEKNNGILGGIWRITNPDGSKTLRGGADGSEINATLFEKPGKYSITFQWTAQKPYYSYFNTFDSDVAFSSQIEIEVGETTEKHHRITLITRYLDDALPESTQTYSVEHESRFEQQFDVLEGYDLANMELRTFPDFDVDMDTKTVSLDPVEKDYTIILEFDKIPVKKHNVKVITRYLDNALLESTTTYQVEHSSHFLESFEILDGYELYNSMLRNQPVFHVDMYGKTVGLDTVDRNYTIILEFDKAEYKVKLNTSYIDGYLPDNTSSEWVRYQETYIQTYEIAEGYEVVNLGQLPEGVIIDEINHTVAVYNITQDFEINLIFQKIQYDVTIKIVYEDGSRDEQMFFYPVLYGDRFEVDFDLERQYSIKNVSFNAVGVSVNRTLRTVTIDKMTSLVEIVIIVR